MDDAATGQAAWCVVDARGHRCPVPTLRLLRALDAAPAGASVLLLADDPMARIDVPHFAAQAGCLVTTSVEEGGAVSFSVTKPASAAAGDRGSPPG